MAGMGNEYDKRRTSYAVPSHENSYSSEPANAWAGQQYSSWDYGNKSGSFGPFPGSLPPLAGDSDLQQQHQQAQEQPPLPSTPNMAMPNQHWYGYYPQQAQDRGQVAQGGSAPPPLPTMPPPQPPLPPNSATTPAWPASGQGGANGAPDSTYSSYYSYAHQQQAGPEYSGYEVGESQAINNPPTSSLPHAQTNTVPANGSQPFGQGYTGYGATGEQYGYGNTSFQGYNSYSYPQQGTEAYPQNTAYANTAPQYVSPSNYQNSSSLTDTTSYPSTTSYYDPSGYQSTAYQHPAYNEQPTNSWSDPNYGNYNYTGYTAPSANSVTGYVVPNSTSDNTVHYQQDQQYQQQWADYYAGYPASQGTSDSSVVPQAAPAVSTATVPAPTYASVLATPPALQPPPPGTVVQSSWQASAAACSSTPSSQVSSMVDSSSAAAPWNPSSAQTSQVEQYKQTHFPPVLQQTRTQASNQPQQQSLAFQKAQAALNLQQQQPRMPKLQIPTNPRIAPNAGGLGSVKETQKPAYVSVSAKQTGLSVSTDAVADATLQPGMFPPSLRAYVERALSRCKDDIQKAACQDIMKEMITAASLDGSLFTKDWDTEPLFQLPSVTSSANRKEGSQQPVNVAKVERSPTKRLKTRWEPVGADDSEDKQGHTHGLRGAFKDGNQDRAKDSDNSVSPAKWDKREEYWSKTNSSQHQQRQSRRMKRGFKRVRKGILHLNGGLNTSSGSEEEEEHNDGVHLGSLSTAETPEEKKRRQNRTKRFDRGKDLSRGFKGSGRGRGAVAGSASQRRATALQIALSSGDGQNGRAVEDIDWDSLTVRGTCQEVEKRYLRLTSAPDPHTVRPEEVLRKALVMVQTTTKSYLYRCEQLKSIRQDLTVQRIRDELTVQVYETHARMALEAGDLPEYNQCQTQLKGLYAEGIHGCCNEFAAYSLLYIVFQHGNSRDLLSAMARLTREGKKDEVVEHALAVRTAVAVGNYTTFFRLYRTAPNLSPCLMDLYVEKMRFEAVKCMARSYRPTVPVSFVARTLGFTGILGSEGEAEGLDECEEWLRGHGSHLQYESGTNELVMDAKISATSLFMPEPEDVVPHGDANLALNDFFARS